MSGTSSSAALRRRAVAMAGHTGDEARARSALSDEAAEVRGAALSALARIGRLLPADLVPALSDPDVLVRKRACEVAGQYKVADVLSSLIERLGDEAEVVVEAACWSLGEVCGIHLEPSPADAREGGGGRLGAVAAGAVTALCQVAEAHESPLCREAAVAALGALGARTGLSTVLGALSDKPAVRRRAVVALAAFEGPLVDEALAKALSDPDWQVRQAAEDLLEGGRRRLLAGSRPPAPVAEP